MEAGSQSGSLPGMGNALATGWTVAKGRRGTAWLEWKAKHEGDWAELLAVMQDRLGMEWVRALLAELGAPPHEAEEVALACLVHAALSVRGGGVAFLDQLRVAEERVGGTGGRNAVSYLQELCRTVEPVVRGLSGAGATDGRTLGSQLRPIHEAHLLPRLTGSLRRAWREAESMHKDPPRQDAWIRAWLQDHDPPSSAEEAQVRAALAVTLLRNDGAHSKGKLISTNAVDLYGDLVVYLCFVAIAAGPDRPEVDPPNEVHTRRAGLFAATLVGIALAVGFLASTFRMATPAEGALTAEPCPSPAGIAVPTDLRRTGPEYGTDLSVTAAADKMRSGRWHELRLESPAGLPFAEALLARMCGPSMVHRVRALGASPSADLLDQARTQREAKPTLPPVLFVDASALDLKDADGWREGLVRWRQEHQDGWIVTLEPPGLRLGTGGVDLRAPPPKPVVLASDAEVGEGEEEAGPEGLAPSLDPVAAGPLGSDQTLPSFLETERVPNSPSAAEPGGWPNSWDADVEDRVAFAFLPAKTRATTLAARWERSLQARAGEDLPRQIEAWVGEGWTPEEPAPPRMELPGQVCQKAGLKGPMPLVAVTRDGRCRFAERTVEDLAIARIIDRGTRRKHGDRAARCGPLAEWLRPHVGRGRVLTIAMGLGEGRECKLELAAMALRAGLTLTQVQGAARAGHPDGELTGAELRRVRGL